MDPKLYRCENWATIHSMAQESREPASKIKIEEHLGLVRAVVCKFHKGRFVEDSELFSIGCLALVEAHKTFDPSKSKFCTWATRLIQQRVVDEYRKRKKESPVDETCELREIPNREQDRLPVHILSHMLSEEPPTKDREMLVGHYIDGKSLAELGREFGISKEWVRKKISVVLSSIRRKNRSFLENIA